tara:strand:+ start:12839 stop:14221 length:1383 start_codon:yes stop_codon:yes gene_type:complete
MINVFAMNAQQNNLECATPESSIPDPAGIYSYSTDLNYFADKDPVVLNIYFWGIKYPNGHNDFENREHDVLQAVANLNIMYNQFNIFFKYRGFEEIDSPVLPNDPNGYYILETISQYHGLTSWATANGYKKADAFNVYAFGWANWGGGIASMPGLTCGVSSDSIANNLTVHEIGHNLNLGHTRSVNEHTTRDPQNQYFNADVAGDKVVDTAANSGFYDSSCQCTPYVDQNTCNYFGTETDNSPDNVPYDIDHEDVINIMGNAYGCSEQYLTTGQGIRAREAIAAGYYNAAITNVSSLYEPYAGAYFDPNNPNDQLYKPLFQPGFDYRFFECDCDCPEPAPYEDISFSYTQNILKQVSKYENDFSSIYHPNHTAIAIKIENEPIFWPQPRRCYDNPYRKPNSGSITKFNDNVFNTNITVTQKDSLGINNNNLVEQLEPGLYKIEKRYEEGNTEQDIIFKQE